MQTSNLYSNFRVFVNLVKSLGLAFSGISLLLIDVATLVEYFLRERLSENISVLLAHHSIPHG